VREQILAVLAIDAGADPPPLDGKMAVAAKEL